MVCTYSMNTFFVSLPKKWTLQSALPRHFCVHRDTDKGRTKAENLLQQSRACEMQATSRDQAEPPSGTAPRTRQDEKVTTDTSTLSVCSEMQWPSQDDSQQMWEQQEAPCWTVPAFTSWGGQVIQTLKFSTVPFFHLLLSMGGKLHTGLCTQSLKHSQWKYFPQSSSKRFSPTFLPNKEVKKQPTLPINTAGGSTK